MRTAKKAAENLYMIVIGAIWLTSIIAIAITLEEILK